MPQGDSLYGHSPVDLSTSISATAAIMVLARLATATPRPAAMLPLDSGSGRGTILQPDFFVVASKNFRDALIAGD